MWRVTVVVLPLMLLVLCLGGVALGQGMIAMAKAILSDPLIIVLSLGFAAVAAFFLIIFGLFFIVLGVVGMVLVPLLFVVLSRILGRILRGESRGIAASSVIAVPALLIFVGLGGILVLALAGDFVAQLLALGVLFVVLALPATGPMLLLLPRSRYWSTVWVARRRHLVEPPSARPVEWERGPAMEELEI